MYVLCNIWDTHTHTQLFVAYPKFIFIWAARVLTGSPTLKLIPCLNSGILTLKKLKVQ